MRRSDSSISQGARYVKCPARVSIAANVETYVVVTRLSGLWPQGSPGSPVLLAAMNMYAPERTRYRPWRRQRQSGGRPIDFSWGFTYSGRSREGSPHFFPRVFFSRTLTLLLLRQTAQTTTDGSRRKQPASAWPDCARRRHVERCSAAPVSVGRAASASLLFVSGLRGALAVEASFVWLLFGVGGALYYCEQL